MTGKARASTLGRIRGPMAGKPKHDLNDEEVLKLVDSVGPTQAAVKLGVSRGAVAHRVRKLRAAAREDFTPGKVERDGKTSITTEPGEAIAVAEVMKKFGVDADAFEVVRVRLNDWPNGPQVRVDLVPREAMIVAPSAPDAQQLPPKPRKKRQTKAAERWVICGDFHCPHHSQPLLDLFCQYLADEQPDYGVIHGDLLDATQVSRHRPRRYTEGTTLNDGIQSAFEVLLALRQASPNTRWHLLPGNHDARIAHQLLDHVRGLVDVRAADDEVPALSLRRLLRLDDLGIEFVGDESDWDKAKLRISSKLTVRHGYSASKRATDQLLQSLSNSTLQGHTHRQSIKLHTRWSEGEGGEEMQPRLAAETGAMCEIEDGEGLGYHAGEPDWQNGFLTATVWQESGDFLVAPAVYSPGRLLAPNGKRYTT
jgi:UDP-2,3-diacylglucosamine pyrophosphatase LpxH